MSTVNAGQRLFASLMSPGAWNTITLINGWANGSSGNQKCSVRQWPLMNCIQICGTINGASKTSNTFGVLPGGISTPAAQVQAAAGQSGGSATVTPYLQCDTSGNLSIANAGANVYVFSVILSLDVPAI